MDKDKLSPEFIAKLEADKAAKGKKKQERLEKRMRGYLDGRRYTGKLPHESFPSPESYKKQINAYFDWCELNHEPQTVPGFALAIGLRTEQLKGYDPPVEKWEFGKLTEFAIQRIEKYMAGELSKGTGNTKGKEFLAQNTLGYANKSDVNSKVDATLTERDRYKHLTDDELIERGKHYGLRLMKFIPLDKEDEASNE